MVNKAECQDIPAGWKRLQRPRTCGWKTMRLGLANGHGRLPLYENYRFGVPLVNAPYEAWKSRNRGNGEGISNIFSRRVRHRYRIFQNFRPFAVVAQPQSLAVLAVLAGAQSDAIRRVGRNTIVQGWTRKCTHLDRKTNLSASARPAHPLVA
jgi:hypothetical protein